MDTTGPLILGNHPTDSYSERLAKAGDKRDHGYRLCSIEYTKVQIPTYMSSLPSERQRSLTSLRCALFPETATHFSNIVYILHFFHYVPLLLPV